MQGVPSVAAAHIRGISEAGLWPYIRGIEIGNEVDHWPKGVQVSVDAHLTILFSLY
eukprot:COSAG05_NODE_540_length_8845_cov_13.872742_6_plen_56_part_00